MKKFLLLTTLLCGWMGSAMAADANTIAVKDATAAAGDVTVELEMANPTMTVVAFQCDVNAETAVFDLATVTAAVAEARKVDHTIAYNVINDGKTLRLVSYSMTNAAYKETSGIIATFGIPLTETTTFSVDNIVLADAASKSDKPAGGEGTITIGGDKKYGDINGDGFVDTDDLTIIIDYILRKPVEYSKEELDITGDNLVDTDDLTEIIDIILRKK